MINFEHTFPKICLHISEEQRNREMSRALLKKMTLRMAVPRVSNTTKYFTLIISRDGGKINDK